LSLDDIIIIIIRFYKMKAISKIEIVVEVVAQH